MSCWISKFCISARELISELKCKRFGTRKQANLRGTQQAFTSIQLKFPWNLRNRIWADDNATEHWGSVSRKALRT